MVNIFKTVKNKIKKSINERTIPENGEVFQLGCNCQSRAKKIKKELEENMKNSIEE